MSFHTASIHLEGQPLSGLLNCDIHHLRSADIDGIRNGFHPMDRTASILCQRLILRQQGFAFQKLQEKPLRIALDICLRLGLNKAIRVLEPGQEGGLRHLAHGVIAVEFALRRMTAEQHPERILFRAMFLIRLKIMRFPPTGDRLDGEVAFIIGNGVFHTLVDLSADVLYHGAAGLCYQRDRSLCEEPLSVLRQIQRLVLPIVHPAEQQAVVAGDTAVLRDGRSIQVVHR